MRSAVSAIVCQMQQLLHEPSDQNEDCPTDKLATASQVYHSLSEIGAVQELVPQLSLQLKRLLEIITGMYLYQSHSLDQI